MLTRRTLVKSGLAVTALGAMPVRAHNPVVNAPFPIFDTHPHFYAPNSAAFPHKSDISRDARAKATDAPMTREVIEDYWNNAGILMGTGVQYNTVYGTDNRYLLQVASEDPGRIIPVVILNATDPETPAALRRMTAENKIAGVRLFGSPVGGEFEFFTPAADAAWEAINELGIVAVLMLVGGDLNRTMGRVHDYAMRYPNVRIELDHAGYPNPDNNPETFGLPVNFFGVMRHPNIYYKLTSFHNTTQIQRAGRSVKEFYDYMRDLVGTDRLMWGSDMGNTPGTMAEHYAMLQESIDATADWPYAERKAFFFDTAYRLFVPGGVAHYGV